MARQLTYLFLDTETTGVTPQDRIVSICWAVFQPTGAEILSKHHIIRPDGFTIPAGATNVHGITTAIARQRGIPLSTALAALYSDIQAHRPGTYVGHNVSFDRPIVINEYSRVRHPENISPLPTFCTMKSTTNICRIPHFSRSGYKWPTLSELHGHLFGRTHNSAHDAAGDVQACAKCFFELLERGSINV